MISAAGTPETEPERRFHTGVPAAAAALLGALCSGVAAAGVLPWYVPLSALLLAAAFFRRPWTVLCLLTFLLGWGGFRLREAFEPRPELGTRDFRAAMTLTAADPRISAVPGVSGDTRFVRAKLKSYTDPATGRMLPGRGATVMLVLPKGDAPPRFGTVIEAAGTISPLADGESDGFREHLRRRGDAAVIRVERWRAVGRERGLRTLLADGRDAMLTRLFSGVRDPEVRRLAAALYCGIASGLPGEVRAEFGAAGIIHIFSVSGLHVAVLALCFAWLLRFLPFRSRCPLLAALVWLYVLATGAGTPAVRAGVMVTLWALLRMLLLKLRGSDVLCWTAALVLVVDPALISEPGAQYSFLITGALLLLTERQKVRKAFRHASDLVPPLFTPRRKRLMLRMRTYSRTLGISALTAFLAGAAISLRSGRRLGTGAVAANILIALLMPGFFALFLIQLALGTCGAGRFGAPLFEWAFRRLRAVAAFFGENFPDIGAVPPHWSVALLYVAALLAALRSRRRIVRVASYAVLVLICLWQLIKPFTMAPALLVCTSEHGRPPLAVVADPARRRAVAVNIPDPGGARRAAEFLRARGIRELDLLVVASPEGFSAAGLSALRRELAVRRIRVGADLEARLPVIAGTVFESAVSHGDLCRTARVENGFRLDYFDPGSKLYIGVSVTAGDAGYEAVAEHGGKRTRHRLPWSIDRKELEHEFTE